LIFVFLQGGGEFYCFLYQCSLKQFFSDTGDVCRRLCRRPSLLVAHSEATRVLTTPYAVPHTRDLQKFVLWGCFGCGNTTHRKKLEGKKSRRLPRPFPASMAVHRPFRCDERARHIGTF
jgi:hypothetical protein